MNAERLTTPIGKVRQLQRKLYLAAKTNSKRRFHALYDKVYREDILWEAWKRVKENKGAAGIDGQTITQIYAYGEEKFIREIQEKLLEGKYQPQPVRRVHIPKNEHEKRPLGIPTVRDRVIQMACKIVIEPVFEADFLDCSFGFRPQRNAHQALERIRTACGKAWWVVDLDIRKYFDSINHRVSDRRILKLIRMWLKAGIMEEGNYQSSEIGSPQGGVISPLLANIYLHYFDKAWSKYFAHLGTLTRYADDAVVVCRHYRDAQEALKAIGAIMRRLELQIHPEKTRLVQMWGGKQGFDFLGFHHKWVIIKAKSGKRCYSFRQWPSEKAMKKMRKKVKEVLAYGPGLTQTARELVEELNPIIRGWRSYYGLPNSNAKKKLGKVDWYILKRMTLWLNRKKQRKGRHQRMKEAYETLKKLKLEQAGKYRMLQDEVHRKAV